MLTRWIALTIALVILALLAGLVAAAVAPWHAANELLCEVATDAEHEKQRPAAAQESTPAPACSVARRLKGALGFFDMHGEAFTALFTIVLAISTILLWSATQQLWLAGERQIEIAKEAALAAGDAARTARDSVEVSRDVATAARDSVDVARDTAARQLRAYVSIRNCKVNHLFTEGQRPIINYEVVNDGQTLATDMKLTAEVYFADKTGNEHTNFIKESADWGFVGPGRLAEFSLNGPTPDDAMIGMLKDGKRFLFCTIQVEYGDTFGASHKVIHPARTEREDPELVNAGRGSAT